MNKWERQKEFQEVFNKTYNGKNIPTVEFRGVLYMPEIKKFSTYLKINYTSVKSDYRYVVYQEY